MKNKYSMLFLLAVIITIFPYGSLFSQGKPVPWDSKGTDFWFTFLPNYHNHFNANQSPVLQYGDSLYIFVAADVPTTGNIEFRDRLGNIFNEPFSISNPADVYTFSVSSYLHELWGFNKMGIEMNNTNNDTEKISRLSFHITTDEEVTVYAQSQAITTSDAFMIFPTDVLGNDYFVLSYNSHGYIYEDQGGNEIMSPSATPSQFAIVAVENNTEVTIKPSIPTFINGAGEQRFNMNRGEVYLVQADISSRAKMRADLTGTEIISTKPVAVFTGHQRATVPVEVVDDPFGNNGNPSRDMLVEQMPPLKNWGKNILVSEFRQPNGISPEAYDLYRVLSGYDNNQIYINGFPEVVLNKGEYLERKLDRASHISAEKPVLTAQIKSTSDYSVYSGDNTDGDPFLMIIPPIEQFMDNYKVVNTQAKEIDDDAYERYDIIRYQEVYHQQYITVILPNPAKNSLRIDGNTPASVSWMQVPASNYSYAHIRVSDGAHEVKADEPFGIQIYGYGYANSYGYIGGMSFEPHDYKKPEILAKDTCFIREGIILDTAYLDSGIDSCWIVPGSEENVRSYIEHFTKYADSVHFRGELKDRYQDGRFEIAAIDSFGQENQQVFEIPGFTVDMYFPGNKHHVDFKARAKREYCFDVLLENYGRHEQTVDYSNFKINSGVFFLKNLNLPLTLQPGQILPAQLCLYSDENGEYSDTLLIGDDCTDRQVITGFYHSVYDTKKPDISVTSGPCNWEHQIVFTDSTFEDFGIMQERVVENINCNISRLVFTPTVLVYEAIVEDPYLDAYFELEVIDSVGNTTTYSHEIPGFTIDFSIDGSKAEKLSYGESSIGTLYCDSISLYNYGKYSIVFQNPQFFKNIYFSAPPSQFPIEIPPGEERFVKICYKPLSSTRGIDRDTIYFSHNCLIHKVAVDGIGEELKKFGTSRCDADISLTVSEVPDEYFLEQSIPNPAMEDVEIVFGSTGRGDISISLFDSYGRKVMDIISGEYPAGVYKIGFSTSHLPAGVYFYRMTSPRGVMTKSMVISR